MVAKVPVRVNYNNGNPEGLAEYQSGETIDPQFLPTSQGWTYVQNTTPQTPADSETWYAPNTGYVYVYKTNAWQRITTDDQLSDSTESNNINAGHF